MIFTQKMGRLLGRSFFAPEGTRLFGHWSIIFLGGGVRDGEVQGPMGIQPSQGLGGPLRALWSRGLVTPLGDGFGDQIMHRAEFIILG